MESEILIENSSTKELPFCTCGCGKKVSRKGNNYINGHNGRHLVSWNKGIKASEETKNKLKGRIPWNKGIAHSEEAKRKMSLNNSRYMLGKKCSEELKNKISEAKTGEIHSKEWNSNVSKALKGKDLTKDHRIKISIGLARRGSTKGKKVSNETKQKMSVSARKRIERIGSGGINKGKNEKYILDIIEDTIGIKILRNNQQISRKIKGRVCDGYINKYNLPLEVIEKPHFKANGELIKYDHIRQIEIANNLCCMIYYIPEQEFLKNQENEIQRLKNFLVLLDQQIN